MECSETISAHHLRHVPEVPEALACAAEAVRRSGALVHCITNYVTVESCANAVLAVGASPIMSDEPEDVRDITAICPALVLNIGTLNTATIAGMHAAGSVAASLQHAIVLDPVGAGASALRTSTACELLDSLSVSIVRGNVSEIKALSGSAASTKGVDADPGDAVCDETLGQAAAFARSVAARTGAVVAMTGAIDVVADADRAFAIRNGDALQSRITGCGCMLSAICGAYAAAAQGGSMLEAACAAVVHMGLAGQMARARMAGLDGTGSFHAYLMDALSTLTPAQIAEGALIEEIR